MLGREEGDLRRRGFLGWAGAAAVQLGLGGIGSAQTPGRAGAARRPGERLAGLRLEELRQRFYHQLFDVLLPFWDEHGVDHEYGGIMCSLDYDGRRVNTQKNLWFLGRAIWVYSFLYNHFGKNPKFLEVARATKEFVFKYALQKDGWWAEDLEREGKVLRPFSGDLEGMYFIAEGLQEYAAASGEEQARETALTLFKKLFRYFNNPDFRYRGADFTYLWNSRRALRPQGLWFLNLNIATQILERGSDAEVAAIADQALEAIMRRHYDAEIGLNTEVLYFDFSPPPEEAHKVRFGHGVEALWMAMEEADRRQDELLWRTCAARIRHHLDVGWDHIYGGLSQWINVDQACYQWPVETPPGTRLELHYAGEYEYMKALWAQNEVLVAALNVYARTREEWAARYFDLAFQVINQKFSQKSRGYPAGYVLFTDRRITAPAHVARQDNYHPLRQLMFNILTLDRMLGNA
jgi:mannose/cellobiose epimerase-like protein (N-acyl-D-glucosamine 2-epimerase family)